ncbi:nonribosomal siderophore peptide synthase Sid2 [Xylariales sp. AK1849]|nr:nonribosomal siderophore peptide synthase Sid2 [Xylariales sp. AK1849]
MGYIFADVDDTPGVDPWKGGQSDISSTGQAKGDSFRSFEVIGLGSDYTSTPTGMRDEVLLLSWLIVLLRTREDGRTSCDWAYKSRENGIEHEIVWRCLSVDDVMTNLQNNVRQVARAISLNITTAVPGPYTAKASPASLFLSTGTLSRALEGAKDEGMLHLEVRFEGGRLEIRPVWYSKCTLQYTVTRHIEALIDVVKMCISNPDASIEECIRPTAHDLDHIWRWNHQLPTTHDFCMHDMISGQAQKSPDKVAISSWDGDLTYAQIEQYSTFLAHSLRGSSVEIHDFVPVCFEKSRWTVVAVLAVMKAGATIVLMDPTLPLARLQNMAQQVSAKFIVTSRMQHDLSTSIMPAGKLLVVGENSFTCLSDSQLFPELPAVLSTTLLYIIFTSGSTGTPKGVKISHRTYTSSAIPRAKAVGYTENSRVLDFASYAFDVSIDSMLLTLANGGCLCIPSDDDRLNDINGAIRRMQVTYAGITPSVARILDQDVITSLSGLGLGGEAASASDVTLWGRETRIIIGYGPCECTIGCTVNSSAATGRDYISIGPGNGAAIWITNPNDHESLMPVGAVGELLVEGPIVGEGYLNDPEKTAAAFIHNPPWLLAGHKGYTGRQGRLYKTGDLGKYDPDGSGQIVFVGRKDTQVKLRGQRVELGEIESQLKARLPAETTVIAEVIGLQSSEGQPTLVAFVAPQSTKENEHIDLKSSQPSGELRRMLSEADAGLAKLLPRYMVPTAYIPVNYIPTLISGKTDRKRLRQFGATVDLRQVNLGPEGTVARQLSDLEQRLRQAWGLVLKLDADTIRSEDNFFALGGDSLAAMRLVSVCRERGLDLSVTSTFGHPLLSAMAGVVLISDSEARMDMPAFSMITQPVESACMEASHACGIEWTAIEDIYPCTPTQESLFTFSVKSTEAYVAQRVACIPSHISLDAWKKAWEVVVAASPILRTRLVQLQDPGLQQVVLKESINWRNPNDLSQYVEDDRNESMDVGQSLARYAIVDKPNDGKRYMVWTVHHVLYDGWSEPLVLEQVLSALQDQSIETQTRTHMRDFVKFVRDTEASTMQEFWQRELRGAVGPQYPRLPSRDFLPTPSAMVEHLIPLETRVGWPFTVATLIRGAWALVASQYTRSDDVVFGETLTGRDVPLPGVEHILGPLVATVPVRIRVDRTSSVASYLQKVQQSITARTPHQHMGMQNIRKVSQDAQFACEAGTGLVIQPETEHTGNELGFDQGDAVREALHFNPYPLMLAFGLRKGGFRVCASFDSSLVEVPQMKRILVQLETACLQLTKDLSRSIDRVSCLPDVELSRIWSFNQLIPLPPDESAEQLRADASMKPGSIYPRTVVSWVCDPRNPSLLSPIGCAGELWLEVAPPRGETVQSPTWLVAGNPASVGRTGTAQPTGDIVQLREDGSMMFVGRKEDVIPVQGHAVDIAELEDQFTRHLPSSTRAAVAVVQTCSDSTQQGPEQELVIFIEQQPFEEDNVEVMPAKHDISYDASDLQCFKATICAMVPISLIAQLKKLDKFILNSLPSHMMPSAYVVVSQMPTKAGRVDHNLLQQLAARTPCHILDQLREGFKRAWKRSLLQEDLTPSESILRSSWAKLLGILPEQIDVDDNFFRLGGDSVLAMKLVSGLRAQGHGLTVADVFQHMRLGDEAKVLKVDQVSTRKSQPYRPFSTLGSADIGTYLSAVVRPRLDDPCWSIRDVSPVTDSQALDVRATVQAPRTSIQYNMLYFTQVIDRKRLFRACNDLVRTHDILRTVFIEHESMYLQVVLDELEVPVTTRLTDQDIEQFAIDVCTEQTESDFHLGSSFLRMLFVEGKYGRECLIIGLSHAQYDGVSLPMLLQDLETLYNEKQIAKVEPFSSYMALVCDRHSQAEAVNYWSDLLKDSSLSVLDGPSIQSGDMAIFHQKPVDNFQPLGDITTANVLTAAWALVLARTLRKTDVTFGSVTSGRAIDLENVENVIGPCYQFVPIRVSFKPRWTGGDLLQFVQRQSAASAAYDFLGFEKISKQCTQWSSEVRFFDSIVHHQDFEDYDTMPFAGASCRVDILNPHGDAAYPLKAVSFVRGGKLHVGVVGSTRDSTFVDSILTELAAAVQELASRRPGPVLFDSQKSYSVI